MLAVRPGVGCVPAPPGTIPAIFGIMDRLIGLEVPGARPSLKATIQPGENTLPRFDLK
jgi:hypothetical protein